MGKVWILVSMLLMFFPKKCISMTKSNFTDQSALLAFKAHITFDPHNILAHNWSSKTSFCNWIGISCSLRRQRVAALNLPDMGLVGTIPPQLGNLSFLQFLNIRNNNFHGYLPSEIGNLYRLKSIDVQVNNFTGVIPESFGNLHNLQLVTLATNSLTGTIPSTVFNISSLQVLDLISNNIFGSLPMNICDHVRKLEGLFLDLNQLSGQIPSELWKCRELQSFSLSDNNFIGEIPEGIGYLPTLKMLNLEFNKFSGALPQAIFNMTSIQSIYLSFNNLSGSIPHQIGNIPNLKDLDLHKNELTGHIPSAIFNISSIRKIYLDYNKLSGSLPNDLCYHLPLLEDLIVQLNQFSGQIPQSLSKCGKLHRVVMGSNNFTGNLPGDIGNLSLLTLLYVGNNMLSGLMPQSLANLSKMEKLDLSYNRMHGNIPQELGNLRALKDLTLQFNYFTSDPSSPELGILTSLTNCRQLQKLWIGDNPLNGILPNSIGNLSTSLTTLDVSSSRLKGHIPSEVGNLSSLIGLALVDNSLIGSVPITVGRLSKLQVLYLHTNKLEGSIPNEICPARHLAVLALDGNRLSGVVPNCIGNLTSLRQLHFNSNALSSTIPLTLWGLKDLLVLNLGSNSLSGSLPLQVGGMKALLSMDLSRNQLSGNIPSSIGLLQSVTDISLSNNSFQGPIPGSFGDIISLEFLDLSQNNLSGEIPKSLEKLIYLKNLNVSFNRLQGEIPSGGPFAYFIAQSFMWNKALCGPPRLQVPECSSDSHRRSRSKLIMLRFISPLAASLFFVVAFILFLTRCQRRCRKNPIQEASIPVAFQTRITYLELLRATNEFHESNLLGAGSFGSVYQGVLPNGLNVAVKVFNLQLQGAFRSFDTECEIMRSIRHRNLVKIICSCSNLDFKALVLQYMPNASLETWLYSCNYCLDIIKRLNIMIDVASALEYLHHGYSTPVVHCDLKPSNVLLDEDMVAHVCDFGIAKLFGERESILQTKTLATVGYMAPEYGMQGVVSTKIDVYSFGIMMMEIFTRKKPTDEMFNEEMSLRRLVKESFPCSLLEIIDGNLLNTGDRYSLSEEHYFVSSIMELALECTKESPAERSNTIEILVRLKRIKSEFLRDHEMP